ncbi:MAG: hypothetical protein PHT80_02340, partial [Lentisphaeria bacterium]|nr:hypothetical protein [Lentisphaeria bacterium]
RLRTMIYCSDSDKKLGPEVPWPYFTVEGSEKISVLSEKMENCLATRAIPHRLGRRDDALLKAVSFTNLEPLKISGEICQNTTENMMRISG